jgi:hypothetical protein
MFDGFDEVNEMCQDKAIELMKAITKDNSIQFYVTNKMFGELREKQDVGIR